MEKLTTYVGVASAFPEGRLYDGQLVVQDLLNHIYTRQGERVMDPTYGSIIWDLLFEHKSRFVVSEIQRDLTRIIQSDNRVDLISLEVIEQEYGYLANVVIQLRQLNQVENFKIQFNNRVTSAPAEGLS